MAPHRILTATGEQAANLAGAVEAGVSISHCLASPRWLSVLAKAYGVRPILFVVQSEGGATLASLPAYHGPQPSSLYGLRHGLQADTAEAAAEVVQAARLFAEAQGMTSIDLGLARAGLIDSPSVVETTGFGFDLSVCDSEDDLWALLSSHGRRSLRAALRSGQELRAGKAELAPAIELYQTAMRQKGVRVHSSTFLEQIAATFAERFVPIVCYEGQQPVASAFLLLGKRVGAYLYGGSTERSLKLQSGSLLYLEMMRRCLASGATAFDAGESKAGSGTYEFKRRFGARPVPQYYLREIIRGPATLRARISARQHQSADLAQRLLVKAGALVGWHPQFSSPVVRRRII